MLKNKIHLLGFFIVLISFNATAKMYKWVDEEGNTHYSQSPPLEHEAEVITPPPKVDTDSAIKQLEKQRESFNKADEEKTKVEEEQKRAADELALKKENCRLSRTRLQSLQNSRRIRTVDESGNITRASEEEHQSRIKQSMENVKEWCE